MNVPKLRFKGFEGSWEGTPISLAVKITGGATPAKSEKKYWEGGHIPWVSSQEVGPRYLNETTHQITERAVEETSVKIVPKNVVLLVSRSGILKHSLPVSVTSRDMAINQDIKALLPKEGLSSQFLYQWLKGNEEALLSRTVKGGTTVQSVNMPDLQKQLIHKPCTDEQNKISRFLSLLDRRIELQQAKFEALKEQKKGLLQKVFSNKNSDWSTYSLNDIGEFKKSYSVSRAAEGPGEVRYIHYGDIHAKYESVIQGSEAPTISIESYSEFIGNRDLIFADASEDYKDLGKCIMVKNISGEKVISGLHTHRFQVKEDIDPQFILYWTQTDQYFKQIRIKGSGISVLGISKTNLGKFKIKLPSFKVQQELSAMFNSLDEKIYLERRKVEILQEQKKGLMQQMFV